MKLKFKDIPLEQLLSTDFTRSIDQSFLAFLKCNNSKLFDELNDYRNKPSISMELANYSEWLMRLSSALGDFIAHFFDIKAQASALKQQAVTDDPIFYFKNQLAMPLRHRAKSQAHLSFHDLHATLTHLLNGQWGSDPELRLAIRAKHWQTDPVLYASEIDLLTHWIKAAWGSEQGQAWVKDWSSFKKPKRLDFNNLVPTIKDESMSQVKRLSMDMQRERDGFSLTDPGMERREIHLELDYCIYCHKQQGDFCRRSFPVKKSKPELGIKTNPLGQLLTGCPLDQRISESQYLKKTGEDIAALAMLMLDNPLCLLTGHRICNDCMQSCIYQKQESVNIPEIESRILKDVLHLPWGVEIVALLMRWNPLDTVNYLEKPYQGKRVLVMGLGPSGLAMSHYLTHQGCGVVGMDGANVEPLPRSIWYKKINHYKSLVDELSEFNGLGFGGVAEYGITARWDKNLLKLLYVLFLRKPLFKSMGNIRFGGTITIENAWELGFDHMVLAVGAGLPQALSIPNSMAPGMYQANDFLMNIHLNQAPSIDSLCEFELSLPAVVIGSGLTAIDTATEVQAYYIRMVEKIYYRYEQVIAKYGQDFLKKQFSPVLYKKLELYHSHGLAVVQAREQAIINNRPSKFQKLIQQWGGVSIVYRRRMQDSPAYKTNSLEITKALEEGITYLENLDPYAVTVNHEDNSVSGLTCVICTYIDGQWQRTESKQHLVASSIFVATGAKPNIAYYYEHKDSLRRFVNAYESFYFKEGKLIEAAIPLTHKNSDCGVFTSYQQEEKTVTFIGDTHPVYQGSVVKAIASAKNHYEDVLRALKQTGHNHDWSNWSSSLDEKLRAKIKLIRPFGKNLLMLTIYAPQLYTKHQVGHFYRVKPFCYDSIDASVSHLPMQAVPLIGLTDPNKVSEITFLLPKESVMGVVLQSLAVGDYLAVMGPTGVRAKVLEHSTQLVIGGLDGALYALAWAPHLSKHHAQLVYCDDASETIDPKLIEKLKHFGIKCLQANEMKDITIIELINTYFNLKDGQDNLFNLKQIILFSPAKLSSSLKIYFSKKPHWSAHPLEIRTSVLGPMQCMLKGICAQCLQWQSNEGVRTKAVYACSWQIQPAKKVDYTHLQQRQVLSDFRVQSTLNKLWLSKKSKIN